jgi:hypothetical protein
MFLSNRTSVLASFVLLSIPSIPAQTVADPSGHWEGSIQVESREVKIEIDLTKSANGELTGAFSNPTQNLRGLPLGNFAVDGNAISFQIKGKPGERAFKGALSSDGNSLSGDYNQAGYTLPFTLTRTGDARIEPSVRNAPIAKELEGTWNGTLEADGKQLHIILTLSNQPDGTSTGYTVSVDEGLEVPISNITQNGRNLSLDFRAVGSTYSGALSADNTELSGTYTQGSFAAPVRFRRATATASK